MIDMIDNLLCSAQHALLWAELSWQQQDDCVPPTFAAFYFAFCASFELSSRHVLIRLTLLLGRCVG